MISKIAIFRALYFGDMLCIIPTVRSIRAACPHAEIALIGLPWQVDFVRRFDRYFDRFIEFPGWPGLPEQSIDPDRILSFLQEIRKHEFDLVLQMQGNGAATNRLCMMWGARKVCGLRRAGGYAPDESLFPVSEDTDHEVTRFFKLLECLDMTPAGQHLEFPLTAYDEAQGMSLMDAAGLKPRSYVCIHPGARDPRRRWSLANFSVIARHIKTLGFPVVLTGSAEEAQLLNELQAKLDPAVVNTVETFGHLPAGTLAYLIRHARLLVSNDTGVSHLATALKTPSVIVFSPYSHFDRWRPLDPIRHEGIRHDRATDTNYVWKKVKEKLTPYRVPNNSIQTV